MLDTRLKAAAYILTVFSLSFIFSCADVLEPEYTNEKSIELFLGEASLRSAPYLKIKNSAFSREFLFYGSFIPMLNSPTGHSFKGRIIRFEPFDDRVIMLESPKGHIIPNTIDSSILLAEFPIVQHESDGIVIDFAKGMTSAFTTRNVHSKELSDKNSKISEQFRAIFLTLSYVKSISVDENVLTINQIAQWRNAKSELLSAEFRYFLREYSPSPTFKKKAFSKNRWEQYFSTPPQLVGPTTQTSAFITKWPTERPIIFHISANTPPQFKDAIRDGILFWNHIFGREYIIVRDLPENISAPHPHLNIVQWVPWDNEASAYADMVIDHLTGETLQAQIYLRSGWVLKSAKKLKTELSELLLESFTKNDEADSKDIPIPSMFDYQKSQSYDLSNFEALVELSQKINSTEISDSSLSVLTSDIIRTVIAHEMGHVLGLRHNLASSLMSNINLNERSELLKNYLSHANAPLGANKYLSESIMDVFSAADDALMGSQIRELSSTDYAHSPLATIYRYDREAIDYGYSDIPMKGDTPFCSDNDIKHYVDCQRWDSSNTPVLFAIDRINSLPLKVSVVLAQTFMAALDPKRTDGPLRASDVPLSSAGVVKNLATSIKQLFSWFNQNARSIQIEYKNPIYGLQNRDDLTKMRFDYIRKQLESLSIGNELFGLMPPFRSQKMSAKQLSTNFITELIKLISQAQKDDPNFFIKEEEIVDAQNIATKFFSALNNELIVVFATILSRMQFDDPKLQLPIEQALGKIAQEIIFKLDKDSPNSVSLPHFAYPLEVRDAAAYLLNPAMGISPDWSFDNLQRVIQELEFLMREHASTKNKTTIDLSASTRELRQWLLEQSRIISTLKRLQGFSRRFPHSK